MPARSLWRTRGPLRDGGAREGYHADLRETQRNEQGPDDPHGSGVESTGPLS